MRQLFLGSVIGLVGCVHNSSPAEQCSVAGHSPGTPEWDGCMVWAEAREEVRRARVQQHEYAQTPRGRCESFGHVSGTSDWAECVDRLWRQDQEREFQRSQALIRSIQQAGDNLERHFEQQQQEQRLQRIEQQQRETQDREFKRRYGLPGY